MAMENPMVGAFNRERTSLVFRQRSLEVYAAYVGLGLGALMVLMAIVRLPRDGISGQVLWLGAFGAMFAGASAWAYSLFRSFRFDLRKRVYAMRVRTPGGIQTVTGSIQEIKCLEIAPYSGLLPGLLVQSRAPGMVGATAGMGQVFVIRLWWNDPNRQPVVLEHLQAGMTQADAERGLAGFGAKAKQYADSMMVPVVSGFPVPGLTPSRVP